MINLVDFTNDKYISLSQQEIADSLHFFKNKINKIMQELIKDNCIDTFNNTKGKYIVSDKGNKIIDVIERIY